MLKVIISSKDMLRIFFWMIDFDWVLRPSEQAIVVCAENDEKWFLYSLGSYLLDTKHSARRKKRKNFIEPVVQIMDPLC